MSVGRSQVGRSGSAKPVQPATVLPWAALVIFERHGQALMERAQALSARPETSKVGRDLELSLAWLGRTAREQRAANQAARGSADPGSESGRADGPQYLGSAESQLPPWSPGDRSLVCTTEAAEMLSVTERQVRRLIREERLSASLVGSRWLIDEQSVQDEVLRRETQGGAA